MLFSLANFDDKFIFVSGGFDRDYDFVVNKTYRYDIENDFWKQTISMSRPRYAHSSLIVGDCFYLIGGNDEYGSLCSNIEWLTIRDLDKNDSRLW